MSLFLFLCFHVMPQILQKHCLWKNCIVIWCRIMKTSNRSCRCFFMILLDYYKYVDFFNRLLECDVHEVVEMICCYFCIGPTACGPRLVPSLWKTVTANYVGYYEWHRLLPVVSLPSTRYHWSRWKFGTVPVMLICILCVLQISLSWN